MWTAAFLHVLRWRWWDPADRQCLWMWMPGCCTLTRKLGLSVRRGSHTTEVRRHGFFFLARALTILTRLLTRLKLAHLSHFSPPDRQVPEQPCQSAHGGGQQSQRTVGDDLRERAGRWRLPCEVKSAASCPTAHQGAVVSFRNATPSASCSSWWGPDTPSWANLTWSPCLSALGIWVKRPLQL